MLSYAEPVYTPSTGRPVLYGRLPRILVVDDEPANLFLMSEVLGNDGYGLVEADSGEHAWQILQSDIGGFDLMVLDRMMPGMSGLDLLERIKTTPRFTHLPVIMQTAASSPEQVLEGLRAGAFYYLTKPYDPASLVTIVRAVLSDMESRRALEGGIASRDRTLHLLSEGRFRFATLDEARDLATLLAGMCPEPARVVIGLGELLVNAVEHGNLGITYQEKKHLMAEGTWDDEVARRAALPRYGSRQATTSVAVGRDAIEFEIRDAGDGFDWENFMELSPDRAFDPNGRGIAIARMVSFDRVEFIGSGNAVRARVDLPRHAGAPATGGDAR
ncbi:MAG: response regulator [Betaproteobacteria bacterium]|nr:response regulator [Betaproteobacteria bacterium]